MQHLNWSFGAIVDQQHILPAGIVDLVKQHKVLVIQNATISTQQELVEYAQSVGKLFPQVKYHKIDEVNKLDYYTGDTTGVDDLSTTTNTGPVGSVDAEDWHQDAASYSNRRMIGMATIQFDKQFDQTQIIGDTSFCNLKGIYDSLSLPMRQLLAGVTVEHTSAFFRNQHYFMSLAIMQALKTGDAKSIAMASINLKKHIPKPFVDKLVKDNNWLNFSPKDCPRILELTEAESRAIIDLLTQQINNSSWIYQHRWQPNQLVIWDNRYVLHRRIDNASINTRRNFWRVQIEI
jgi:alpha-ketoglutarate-dependent taurine dioxygenase